MACFWLVFAFFVVCVLGVYLHSGRKKKASASEQEVRKMHGVVWQDTQESLKCLNKHIPHQFKKIELV